jgi:hypothetical protein
MFVASGRSVNNCVRERERFPVEGKEAKGDQDQGRRQTGEGKGRD